MHVLHAHGRRRRRRFAAQRDRGPGAGPIDPHIRPRHPADQARAEGLHERFLCREPQRVAFCRAPAGAAPSEFIGSKKVVERISATTVEFALDSANLDEVDTTTQDHGSPEVRAC
jgi:hypothetical protein